MSSYGGSVLPSISSDSEIVQQPANDHVLMAAVGSGDVRAFEELIGRHLKTMVAVSQRILGNAAEADEVAQEGFLRLWTYASNWDPNGAGSVKTWLSRVVTNLSLDRYRRRRSVPLEEAGEIEDMADGAFEMLKAKDRKRVVQGLLDALPERQKVAVILSYFEEMSGREVANTMALTEGAVESLLVRARRGLREGMTQLGFVWGEDI
ncbi:MAG: sigma-70 family RNA polymerase sigma factor [Alphaproteobacteria bacterium]|nr:sigma-70 family RNA polymerase sigma factor [Alphaproteobacteria bacterium]